jgi:ABC-2 type transport system ATP-binding protein
MSGYVLAHLTTVKDPGRPRTGADMARQPTRWWALGGDAGGMEATASTQNGGPAARLAGAAPGRPAVTAGPAIQVAGLRKRFGRVVAVEDVSFTVAYGRITGFLGPNGAGKTTTLRMVLGLVRADAGTAVIAGTPYPDLASPARTVGALLAPAAHPGRSGRDQLRVLAAASGIPGERAGQLLTTVGLAHAARQRAGGYSLGMRQRLGLAAALLGDPAVLVLDEPANGLDPQGIRWLRDLLRSLAAEGRAVLISSHILAEVAQTADDVVVIHQGRTIAQAPLPDLLATRPGASLEDIYLELTGTPEGEPS